MSKSHSKRRLAENEVIFRQANESVRQGLDELKKKAEKEGDVVSEDDMPLYFYCECSDESCRKRILLRPSKHKKLHQNSSQFVVLPGHEVREVERVRIETKAYMVVEKYMTPPKKAGKLKPTDVDNIDT